MKAFRFYRRYWAAIGGLIFVGLAFMMGILGDTIPTMQRLMILLYMSLLFHQFEEYIFPGGFAVANNIALFGEKKDINKYPLNEMSALIVNVACAYPLYIVGIFCYELLWYDIFIAYFTMVQVLMHCLKINISLRAWYSPGCLSALFVMLPLGIYTLWHMATHMPSYCWWAPIIAFPFVAFTTILLPILLFKRRDTPYAFAEHQAEDFAIKGGIATLFRKK